MNGPPASSVAGGPSPRSFVALVEHFVPTELQQAVDFGTAFPKRLLQVTSECRHGVHHLGPLSLWVTFRELYHRDQTHRHFRGEVDLEPVALGQFAS